MADLAPGNVRRSHEHFVGRHRELCALHDVLVTGGAQSGGSGMGGRALIAAAHSPGGLGKTALARQYAHAYAEYFAAGGTWEIPCEGVSTVSVALLKLADQPEFLRLGREVGLPFRLTDRQREDEAAGGAAVLQQLEEVTRRRAERLGELLLAHPERHSPDLEWLRLERPRALLLLDNVDRSELLSAAEVAGLPAKEWLEILVTTRLDPKRFGIGERWQKPLEIEPLPDADAVDLIRDFQPGHSFASDEEEAAARELAEALGGYTLAVELVAAYLGDHAEEGLKPSQVLERFRSGGLLAEVDSLSSEPSVANQIRHGEKQLRTVLTWSLERLNDGENSALGAAARTALEYASLLQPDQIPMPWLESMTRKAHGADLEERPGYPSPWAGVWRRLYGLRLLHPSSEVEAHGSAGPPNEVRIHRVVAECVRNECGALQDRWKELDRDLNLLATRFEHEVGHGDDAALRAQYPALAAQLEFLISDEVLVTLGLEATPTLLRSTVVVASYEKRHGVLSRALSTMSRILTIQERLSAASDGSLNLLRDVSVSLDGLGDLLRKRGQAGDAEAALGHYTRGLEIAEKLYKANEDSGAAARDVLVSLQRLSASHAAVPGKEGVALDYQGRSAELSLRLRESNPGTYFHERTAIDSTLLLSQRAQAAGEDALAGQCLLDCLQMLDELVQNGTELDPSMASFHAQLRSMTKE